MNKHKKIALASISNLTSWILVAGFSTCVNSEEVAKESKLVKSNDETLKPTRSMPMWYYDEQRDFRFPLPTKFDFTYIDKTGKIVIKGPFCNAKSFAHGRAPVNIGSLELHDGLWVANFESLDYPTWTLLDTKGEMVCEPKFRKIDSFHDDITVARLNSANAQQPHSQDESVLIDLNGKVKLTLPGDIEESLGPFSEGLAPFKLPGASGVERLLFGYIKRNYDLKIKPQFSEAHIFSEGLAVVAPFDSTNEALPGSGLTRNGSPPLLGYIDPFGKLIIPAQFAAAREFHDGLAVVKKEKWGYVDKTGALVIPCEYEYAGNFSDGLAPVQQNGKLGYIDSSNKIVIPFNYADAKSFSDGLAPATADGINWGYIDKAGNFVLAPIYRGAFSFSDGLALVLSTPAKDFATDKSVAPYLWMTARAARGALDIATAKIACETIIRVAPDTIWSEKSKLFLKNVLPSQAVPSEAVELLKTSRETRVKNLPGAEVIIRGAIKKYPEFIWLYGELGSTLIPQDKYDEAEKVLVEALQKDPNYVRGYYQLGKVFQHKGDEKKFREMLAKVKELDPDDEGLKFERKSNPTIE